MSKYTVYNMSENCAILRVCQYPLSGFFICKVMDFAHKAMDFTIVLEATKDSEIFKFDFEK